MEKGKKANKRIHLEQITNTTEEHGKKIPKDETQIKYKRKQITTRQPEDPLHVLYVCSKEYLLCIHGKQQMVNMMICVLTFLLDW